MTHSNSACTKQILFVLFLIITSNVSFAQVNLTKVVLKSGETVNGINGTLKSKFYKYKNYSGGKNIKIAYSEIDIIQIQYEKDNINIYEVLQRMDDGKFYPVHKAFDGNKVKLYTTSGSGAIPMAPGGMGGFGTTSYTVTTFYIKKTDDEKMTYLGAYNPIINTFKDNVYRYFSDCPKLMEKLENKDFKLKNGAQEIAEFYDKHCGI
ncbi:hypothetical protein [Sediminicola luteus]|uniref:Jacalin-type lectin domain-containing protein n=1 Tax=Sediminicola luteus TaxID=319238 RepID=A0ABV2U0I0_9FLAO